MGLRELVVVIKPLGLKGGARRGPVGGVQVAFAHNLSQVLTFYIWGLSEILHLRVPALTMDKFSHVGNTIFFVVFPNGHPT